MNSEYFESNQERVNFLTDLANGIESLPKPIDQNDFLGMYVCHDMRVMWLAEVLGDAVRNLDDKNVDPLRDSAGTIIEYLAQIDQLLNLAMVSQAGLESTESEWDWRLNSIMMLGQVNIEMQSKWDPSKSKYKMMLPIAVPQLITSEVVSLVD